MKSNRKQSGSSTPAPASRPRSKQRLILFRLVAMALPLVAVVLLELGLRAFGLGYPTSFFIRETINGTEILRDNPKFGWRFFPPAIARTPEPVVFPANKAPGTYRVFVLGESAAMGDPEPSVGLPRMLQAMLEAASPEKRIEVINVAMTAINSHVIREIAKDCASLHGDAWIIYAGNNEVVGPFGAGTVFGAQAPPLAMVRFTLWLKSTRIGQLLERVRRGGPVEWEGMEMFLRQQVPAGDPRLARVYENFRRNIDDIIRIGQDSGAKVVVSTVAVNLRDFPPFASQHSPPLATNDLAPWSAHYTNAANALLASNPATALASLELASKTLRADNKHAEWHYLLGECTRSLGDTNRATHAFRSACEYDTLRFRADAAINDRIRTVARSAGISVVDAADHFEKSLRGDETFYEHVHFTFAGNYALARLIAHDLIPQQKHSAIGSEQQCGERLGWNDWTKRNVFTEVRKRLQQPPFTGQFRHDQRDAEWEQRIDRLSAALTPDKLRDIALSYAALVARYTNDWILREDYATLLAEIGDHDAALNQWRELSKVLPHDALPHFHIGNATDASGRPGEAIPHFREALRRNPALVEARNGLALALSATGDPAAARRELERAIKDRPRFAQAHVNLGQLLASSGDTAAARAHYETALKIEPNSAAARVNLGKLLSAAGDKAAAVEQYTLALKANPHNPIAHYNLANTLLATNAALAVRHYKAAVLAQPSFVEARYALALELARQNHMNDALEQFAETVRLRPDMAEAHFNYGVALAKTSRYTDAIREFRETLRLNPNDAKAREFLQRATALGGG